MKWMILLVGAFLMISCGSNRTTSQDTPKLDGEYQVKSIGGREVASEELRFTFNPADGRVFGFAGCNGFSAGFTQDGSGISLNRPLSTKKYCEGKMQTEQELLTALENIRSVGKEEDTLILYSDDRQALFSITKTDTSE